MQLVISTELTLCSLSKFITKFHYKASLGKILNLFIQCICQIHIYGCVIRIKSRMYLYCLVTLVIYSKQYNLLRSLLCCFFQSLPPQVFPPVLKQTQSKQIARHCQTQLYLLEKQFYFSISYVFQPHWASALCFVHRMSEEVSYLHKTANTAAVLHILVFNPGKLNLC